ncbi:MAG: hypothetical protein ACP5FH_10405, partial [Terracidiphilus sp.]
LGIRDEKYLGRHGVDHRHGLNPCAALVGKKMYNRRACVVADLAGNLRQQLSAPLLGRVDTAA